MAAQQTQRAGHCKAPKHIQASVDLGGSSHSDCAVVVASMVSRHVVAVLFPVVWSIRHLRESSATDGKAAASLNKLRLFRKFYVMVLAYIYTTRILVYLISNSMEFQYEWLGPFFSEIVYLIFYITTGIMFSPEPGNEYLQVPEHDSDIDDHDEESGTVVTTTSVGDGMKRVRRPKEEPSAAASIQQRKDMGLEPDF